MFYFKSMLFVFYSFLLMLSVSSDHINEYYQVDENSFHEMFYLELDNQIISYSPDKRTFRLESVKDLQESYYNNDHIYVVIDIENYPIIKMHFRSNKISITGKLSFQIDKFSIIKETAVLVSRSID